MPHHVLIYKWSSLVLSLHYPQLLFEALRLEILYLTTTEWLTMELSSSHEQQYNWTRGRKQLIPSRQHSAFWREEKYPKSAPCPPLSPFLSFLSAWAPSDLGTERGRMSAKLDRLGGGGRAQSSGCWVGIEYGHKGSPLGPWLPSAGGYRMSYHQA